MNAKRMLLRFLIGNGTYDRLVRMNVIQEAGVAGRRSPGQKAPNVRAVDLFEDSVRYLNRDETVPDHLRLQVLGELPRYSPVDLNLGYPTQT